MNTSDYLEEGFWQLNDTKFYKETDEDLTSLHSVKVDMRIEYLFMHDDNSPKAYQFLKSDS